jgi:hypothetical protein
MIDRSVTTSNFDTVLFTEEDLKLYVLTQTRGLTKRSQQQIEQTARFIWENTKGEINRKTLLVLSDIFGTFGEMMRNRNYTYTRAFMKYLYKLTMDQRLLSYLAIFERPKTRRLEKRLTPRIVIQEDVENMLHAVKETAPEHRKQEYLVYLLFQAYTGQRPGTTAQLTVGMIKEALRLKPPVLVIPAAIDKIRLQHYVPLHPCLVQELTVLIKGREDHETMFNYPSIRRWLLKQSILLTRAPGLKAALGDLRKYFQQESDRRGWDDAYLKFQMTHGTGGVEFSNYRQFLPENAYASYLEYWEPVQFFYNVFNPAL